MHSSYGYGGIFYQKNRQKYIPESETEHFNRIFDNIAENVSFSET